MDLKLYLDTDEDLRLSRKVYRDVCVKKKDIKEVINKYMK
jgi:uridine kinase